MAKKIRRLTGLSCDDCQWIADETDGDILICPESTTSMTGNPIGTGMA